MFVKYLDDLDKLNLSIDDYVISSSGALVAHGLDINNNDLDILIKPDKLNELIYNGKLRQVHKSINGIPKIVHVDESQNIECFNLFLQCIDYRTALSYYFDSSILIGNHRYVSIVPLRHFYYCLVDKFNIEKHVKKLDILKNYKIR